MYKAARLFQELLKLRNECQNLSMLLLKANRQEFSMACNLNDRKNDVKMFKTLQ